MTAEWTLFRLALRQLTASRRALWALALVALPVLIALLGYRETDPGMGAVSLATVFANLIVPVLLPLTALVVGTGVFGAEIEDGTILYVLGKPVARWRMLAARWAAASVATAAVMVPATLLPGLILLRGVDAGGMVLGFTAAVAVGGILYCALFIALSLATRRALVTGLVYVVLWEGTLGGLFAGTRALSIRQYTLAIADAWSSTRDRVFDAALGGGTAAVMALAVSAAAAWFAVRRLRAFEVGEAA